ncbi:MAG: SDR family NAD(P)-dependent oxidoreductase, partial [Hungatella hathewayi]|nr:SDR family NAD(P)-dependent oxidoreductase [Hungatella hathewayi]
MKRLHGNAVDRHRSSHHTVADGLLYHSPWIRHDDPLIDRNLTRSLRDVKWLINSAGFGKIGPVGSINLADEAGMVDLNCKALCVVTHMVLPYLSGNSRIIQLASSASFLPQPDFAIYAA